MPSTQYQLPQQPPPEQPTGQLLNTQPASQMPADKKVASLSMPTNEAMTHLGFANNMLHHLIEYKAKQGKPISKTAQQSQSDKTTNPQDNPQQQAEEAQEAQNPDPKMMKLELDWSKKFDDLRKELDEKHKLELDSLRNDIKTAIAEETNE